MFEIETRLNLRECFWSGMNDGVDRRPIDAKRRCPAGSIVRARSNQQGKMTQKQWRSGGNGGVSMGVTGFDEGNRSPADRIDHRDHGIVAAIGQDRRGDHGHPCGRAIGVVRLIGARGTVIVGGSVIILVAVTETTMVLGRDRRWLR